MNNAAFDLERKCVVRWRQGDGIVGGLTKSNSNLDTRSARDYRTGLWKTHTKYPMEGLNTTSNFDLLHRPRRPWRLSIDNSTSLDLNPDVHLISVKKPKSCSSSCSTKLEQALDQDFKLDT